MRLLAIAILFCAPTANANLVTFEGTGRGSFVDGGNGSVLIDPSGFEATTGLVGAFGEGYTFDYWFTIDTDLPDGQDQATSGGTGFSISIGNLSLFTSNFFVDVIRGGFEFVSPDLISFRTTTGAFDIDLALAAEGGTLAGSGLNALLDSDLSKFSNTGVFGSTTFGYRGFSDPAKDWIMNAGLSNIARVSEPAPLILFVSGLVFFVSRRYVLLRRGFVWCRG